MPEPFKDLVVLLPGITGSVLEKDGKDLWAPSGEALLGGLLSLGRSLRELVVEDDDWRQDDLGDGISAPRLVHDVHLIPGLWKIDGYSGIEEHLIGALGLLRGENYHAFPYDWRRDNRASARLLQRRSQAWLRSWREKSGVDDAQLVLVAHSMGGLVSRYFVEALGGWQVTRAVVTFGTPFYGSLNALGFLLHGMRKGIGPLSVDLTPALQSMTSVHQLVPAYRCVVPSGGGDAVKPVDAGLPRWQEGWSEHVTSFHTETETAAAAARQDPAFAANPVLYRPIVGTDQPTRQSALVRDGEVSLRQNRASVDEGGDGTVPLLSAALSGTEDARTFGPQRHARLQNHRPLLEHLSGILTSLRTTKVGDLRRAVDTWFSMDVGDLLMPGEPLVVDLVAHAQGDPDQVPTVDAVLRVYDPTAGREVHRRQLQIPRASTQVEVGPLPPGSYVVEVVPTGNGAPVSDVVVAASEQESG